MDGHFLQPGPDKIRIAPNHNIFFPRSTCAYIEKRTQLKNPNFSSWTQLVKEAFTEVYGNSLQQYCATGVRTSKPPLDPQLSRVIYDWAKSRSEDEFDFSHYTTYLGRIIWNKRRKKIPSKSSKMQKTTSSATTSASSSKASNTMKDFSCTATVTSTAITPYLLLPTITTPPPVDVNFSARAMNESSVTSYLPSSTVATPPSVHTNFPARSMNAPPSSTNPASCEMNTSSVSTSLLSKEKDTTPVTTNFTMTTPSVYNFSSQTMTISPTLINPIPSGMTTPPIYTTFLPPTTNIPSSVTNPTPSGINTLPASTNPRPSGMNTPLFTTSQYDLYHKYYLSQNNLAFDNNESDRFYCTINENYNDTNQFDNDYNKQ